MIKTKNGKILICLIISILMFNFIVTNVSFAGGTEQTIPTVSDPASENEGTASNTGINTDYDDVNYKFNSKEQKLAEQIDYTAVGGKVVGALIDGVAGIITWVPRILVIIVGGVFQFLGTVVGESAGTTESGVFTMIAPEDILFNKLAITDINFFSIDTFGTGDHTKNLSGNDNPIKLLKQNVATWYMTLRTLAIIILLVVLIYIGIRMAISSVASEKAEYKKMFKNWAVSLALVFLLHYIILLVISVNNVFVNILAGIGDKVLNFDDKVFSNYMSQMVINGMLPAPATLGVSSAVLYFGMVALTFIFLIMYIKRMITIAFLILISPVITITYSIDKIGDGKAQAFSAWMKEFFHNVLIQPFHCIIYLALTSVAMNIAVESWSLAGTTLAILTLFFVLQAETIIKNIFGITSKSTGSALATAAVLSSAYGKLASNKKKDEEGSAPSSSRNVKLPTMNSQKNMNAVTAGGSGGAGTSTPSNTRKPAQNMNSNNTGGNTESNDKPDYDEKENERLSRAMSGGQADVDDYNETMDDKPDPNEDLNRAMSEGQAYADDYEDMMGFGDDTEPKQTTTTQESNSQQTQAPQAAQTDEGQVDTQEQQQQQSRIIPARLNYKPRQRTKFEKAKNFAKEHMPGAGAAGAIMGGTLAGLSGANIAETVGAMGVGKRAMQRVNDVATDTLKDKKKAKLEKTLKEAQAKPYEKQLAGDFIEHKGGKEFDTGRELNRAKKYLEMSDEEVEQIQDQSEKNYVQSLHATRDLYKDQYEGEDADKKVLETMEKIFDEDIKPWDSNVGPEDDEN